MRAEQGPRAGGGPDERALKPASQPLAGTARCDVTETSGPGELRFAELGGGARRSPTALRTRHAAARAPWAAGGGRRVPVLVLRVNLRLRPRVHEQTGRPQGASLPGEPGIVWAPPAAPSSVPRLGWPAQLQPLLLPPPSSLPHGSGRDSAPTLDLHGNPLNTQTQQREAGSRSHGHRLQQWQSWRVGTGPWQGAPEMSGGKQRQPRPPTGLTAREGASRGLPAATCAAPPHLRTRRTAVPRTEPQRPQEPAGLTPGPSPGTAGRGARAWTLGRFLPFSLN